MLLVFLGLVVLSSLGSGGSFALHTNAATFFRLVTEELIGLPTLFLKLLLGRFRVLPISAGVGGCLREQALWHVCREVGRIHLVHRGLRQVTARLYVSHIAGNGAKWQ